MAKKPTAYVAIDVEADGPIPGVFSMLALGAVAYNERGEEVDTFTVNLLPLEGASEDPQVMKFWGEHPQAWVEIRRDPQEPKAGMARFAKWLKGFNAHTIALTKPKGYDFLWVYWYLWRFVGKCPFGWDAIDVRSYIAGKRGIAYKQATKENLPQEWFEHCRHSHVPLEDAREVGEIWWKVQQKREVKKVTGRVAMRRVNPAPAPPPEQPVTTDLGFWTAQTFDTDWEATHQRIRNRVGNTFAFGHTIA